MKKNFLSVIMLSVCIIISACSKKGEPLELPNISDIKSIEVIKEGQITYQSDDKWIKELINQISYSKVTNKQSVQDIPNVDKYIQIDFLSQTNSISSIFFYEKQSKWYIEQPYWGIYIANDVVVEMIEQLK